MKVLKQIDYLKVDDFLKSVTINTLFAKSVVNQYISGIVYVNDLISPSTFFIAHPYGMSLLFGDTNNSEFNHELFNYLVNRDKKRVKNEWLQVYPETWNIKLEEMLGSYLIKNESTELKTKNQNIDYRTKVKQYTRVNFVINYSKYNQLKKSLNVPLDYQVISDTYYIYQNMQGSVTPRYFWDDEEDFVNRGVAFSLLYQGEIVATAFSSFIVDKHLELGIETFGNYRGKGLALYVCSLLIDYCIKHGFEPVWACRHDNIGSFKLAQKLGFEPLIYIPYYELVVL